MLPLASSSPALLTRIISAPLLRRALLFGLIATASYAPAPLSGQATNQAAAGSESPNYRLAGRFAPYKIRELIHSTSVEPNWIENSERFWYSWESGNGKSYYLVDPQAGTKTEIFDNDRIAAELTRITLDPWDGKHLPIRKIKFIDENTLQFETSREEEEEDDEERDELEQDEEEEDEEEDQNVHHFEYDVTTRTLRELADWEGPDNHPSWASVSPDGQTVVFARNHNLHMMSGVDYARILDARRGESWDDADDAEEDVEIEDTRLTTDGEGHYSYEAFERGPTDGEREEDKDKRKRAGITWSKDSRRFAMIRNDRRTTQDLWVIHSTGNDRPELETYRYDMAGDTLVAQPEILIYDLPDRNLVKTNTEGWKDQRLFLLNDRQFIYPDSEEPRRSLWLSESSDELHFVRRSRDQHRIDVMVANASTGEVRVLIEERLNTYVENQPLELLASGDMLWWSERDGWAHLYRFGPDGTLRNRLTEGPFSVRRVVGVDEDRGIVYFMANAREAGEDPYYQHLYRVNMDGTGLQLVDPGDFDHRTAMGESNRFFVDNYARVNSVPASALYDVSGRKIMDLEVADFSQLVEAGYQFPEPYTVKADDGITDLYGNIYRPFDFDPDKTYPIVAYVYPGPQTEAVSKFFSTNASETALAQFGIIVIIVGNRGGHPARSKWYHNYGYGNLRDYGLADKKAAIEQLADRYDYIDIGRVGIYGHSGGGFMSTAAMLVYPDFFKVAVSSSGNHDNDVYQANWSEKHDGIKEVVDDEGAVTFEYDIDRNSDLAANLRGHLLLTTSDEDNNVHPAGTLRMADALIKANKRFDFFIFPGQRHSYGSMSDYWFWLRAEYFVDHLLGNGRWSADIAELQVEEPKTR